MTEINWGPEGAEWKYSQSTKTFDISGGASNALKIATTQGPADTFFTISPEQSALVIVDMQNFFLHPRCMDHPNGLKAVEPTLKVLEKCREAGIQVIWLNWGLKDEDMKTLPAGVRRGFMKQTLYDTTDVRRAYTGLGEDLGEGRGRCLFTGSWNADIYGPLKEVVKLNDLHCAKNRMSGLWTPDQPLWKTLTAENKTTLFFTGVNTDQCVLGTLVDGYNAGWNCILVDDCCGTPTLNGKDVCLHNISCSYGFVTNSAAFVAAK